MAYGLRAIQNKGYVPYGNGRDGFFILDPEYRGGRRTPLPDDAAKLPVNTGRLLEPKKQPAEIRRGKSAGSAKRSKHGVTSDVLETWHASNNEPPFVSTDNFVRWTKTKGGSRGLARSASSPQYVTTSSDWGTKIDFDSRKLPEKYERFSMPMAAEERFDYLDLQHSVDRLSETVKVHTIAGGRKFRPEMMSDKYCYMSTPVVDEARWKHFDESGTRFHRLKLPGKRHDKRPITDKYPYHSTPISDVARFSFVDKWPRYDS